MCGDGGGGESKACHERAAHSTVRHSGTPALGGFSIGVELDAMYGYHPCNEPYGQGNCNVGDSGGPRRQDRVASNQGREAIAGSGGGLRATRFDQLHHAKCTACRSRVGQPRRTYRSVRTGHRARPEPAGESARAIRCLDRCRTAPYRPDVALLPAWREEPIGRHHDRKRFDCGSPDLNVYLSRYARQNHESGGAKTFVAVSPAEAGRVLGYYSISPGAIEFARVPPRLTRKLGRYDVPVFRLGRLAVDRSVQGRGLGGELLLAAGERALAVSTQVGGTALAIDAKDEHAAGWYERFGAVELLDDPLKLILPLVVIAAAIDSVGTR